MRSPCEGCAFSEGAAANREPYNLLRATVAAMTAHPFWCHHTKHGGLITAESHLMTHARHHALGLQICEGWRREVVKHVKPGLTTRQRLIRRWMGAGILQMIEEFIGSKGRRKKELHTRLTAAIRKLHADEGFTELVPRSKSPAASD